MKKSYHSIPEAAREVSTTRVMLMGLTPAEPIAVMRTHSRDYLRRLWAPSEGFGVARSRDLGKAYCIASRCTVPGLVDRHGRSLRARLDARCRGGRALENVGE